MKNNSTHVSMMYNILIGPYIIISQGAVKKEGQKQLAKVVIVVIDLKYLQ